MKKTSHSLDEEAAQAIETLSRVLEISRAEVVRRCAVAMKNAQVDGSLPPAVAEGYAENADTRKKRGAVGFNGSMGRAPSMGDLPDGSSEQDATVGMEQPENGDSESDQSGSEDQDGTRESVLDTRVF